MHPPYTPNIWVQLGHLQVEGTLTERVVWHFWAPSEGVAQKLDRSLRYFALDEIEFYFLKVGDFIYKRSKKCMFFWLLSHLEVEMSIGYGALEVPNQSIMQLEVGWLASPYGVVCN